MSIRVVYSPTTGLVQKRGTAGVSLGSFPITYSHSVESVNNITSDYAVTNESFIIVDASAGNITITLPTLAAGRHLSVKKIDSSSNTVTIVPADSETIDGGSNVIITTQWTSITIQAIDGNWYIK